MKYNDSSKFSLKSLKKISILSYRILHCLHYLEKPVNLKII